MSEATNVLPPDVYTEQWTDQSGRTHTVYRQPYRTEGPHRKMLDNGQQMLTFMYAHYVFNWVAGTKSVRISHGTFHNSMPLHEQAIEGPWSEATLSEFGQRFALRALTRFDQE